MCTNSQAVGKKGAIKKRMPVAYFIMCGSQTAGSCKKDLFRCLRDNSTEQVMVFRCLRDNSVRFLVHTEEQITTYFI